MLQVLEDCSFLVAVFEQRDEIERSILGFDEGAEERSDNTLDIESAMERVTAGIQPFFGFEAKTFEASDMPKELETYEQEVMGSSTPVTSPTSTHTRRN